MTSARTLAGVPTGGQFATSPRIESGTSLASLDEHPAVLATIAHAKETGRPVQINTNGLPGWALDSGEGSAACGDTSLGVEPSVRATWATGDDEEPFVTVTDAFYVTGRRDEGDHDLDYDAWIETKAAIKAGAVDARGFPSRIRYGIARQSERIAHTSLDDIGGTEVRSDHRTQDWLPATYTSLERAEGAARAAARGIDWGRDHAPETWT